MATIKARLGDRSYDILVGCGLGAKADSRLARVAGSGRLWVIYDAQVYALHSPALKKNLPGLRVGSRELVLPAGEKVKTQRTVEQLQTFFLSERISRSDIIVAVGGGALTDLVGFVAATTMRGIRWVTMPTTLLGMVDAAVGGKTGINHKLGKNLVGAIWQPRLVLCDVNLLNTLSPRQMLSGLGEVIKYAGLADQSMIDRCHKYLSAENLYDMRQLTRIVTDSVRFKAAVVSEDEHEASLRMILNLGHTFGHGIERALNYKRLSHGEAVIIGLSAAIDLSVRSGLAREKALASYRDLVTQAVRMLPKVPIDPEKAIDGMALDKKRKSHSLRFVLLKRPGQPIIIDKIGKRLYTAALRKTLAEYANSG